MTAEEPPRFPEPKVEAPKSRVSQCWRCRAITVDEVAVGEVCGCGDKAEWEYLVPLPLDVPLKDPETGWRNIYAERLLQRLVADVGYLRLLRTEGPEEAAYKTCEEFGHEARAGVCNRCGGRVGRTLE